MTRMHPLIVGIVGGSGAGKSTLAARLAALIAPLKAAVLSEDAYYRDNGNDAAFDPACFDFDHVEARDHALLREHLAQIKRGDGVDTPRYCFVTHRRLAETDRFDPCDVLILEGLHVLHAEDVRELLDVTVYIDTPDDIRLARRLLRDARPAEAGGRGRDWKQALEQYMSTVRRGHTKFVAPCRQYAHFLIDDSDGGLTPPTNERLDELLNPVVDRLRGLSNLP